MLTGGSGDCNLQAPLGDDEGLDDTLSRVRTLLKFGVLAKGKNLQAHGKEKEELMIERWKNIFSKYDRDGSGILRLPDISRMVRLDLKISERLVSDKQLAQVFDSMDEDGGGAIEFNEFMAFVKQKAKRRINEEDIVKGVGRAVRLALTRNKIYIKELESKFRGYDDLDPITGELGPREMRRFFRNVLDVSKHECSDRNLRIAFNAVDEDGSGSMSTEEFLDFIKFCFRGCPSREVPERIQGLIGGMRDVMHRLPRHRPGTEPGLPPTTVPFCLSGRDLRCRHRLGSELVRDLSQPAMRAPAQPPAKPADSQGGGGGEGQPGLVVHTLSGQVAAPPSPHGAGGLPPLPTGTPIAPSSSAPVLPSIGVRDRFELNNPKHAWTVPKKPLGDYKTFKGAQALNRVEQQLFEVGVDARGMYHRLR